MKWRTTFLAAFAVMAFATHPASVSAEDTGPDALEPLVGDYVLVERGKAIKERNASIDKVVDDLNFFIRSIARSRLRDGNPVPKTLSIRRTGSKLTVKFDGTPWTGKLGGPAVKGESTSGDPLKMTLKQHATTLTQRFDGEQGGKENVFRRSEDGLNVTVRVFSGRLPSDVVYRLTFRRK